MSATSVVLSRANEDQTRSTMRAWRVHGFGPPEAMTFERVPRARSRPRRSSCESPRGRNWSLGWVGQGWEKRSSAAASLTLGSDLSGEVRAVGPGVSICAPEIRYLASRIHASSALTPNMLWLLWDDRAKANLAVLRRSGLRSRHCRDGLAGLVRSGPTLSRPTSLFTGRRQRRSLCGAACPTFRHSSVCDGSHDDLSFCARPRGGHGG